MLASVPIEAPGPFDFLLAPGDRFAPFHKFYFAMLQ